MKTEYSTRQLLSSPTLHSKTLSPDIRVIAKYHLNSNRPSSKLQSTSWQTEIFFKTSSKTVPGRDL